MKNISMVARRINKCNFHCPWSWFWKWCVMCVPTYALYFGNKVCKANQPPDHLCKQTDYNCTIFCNVGRIRGHTNWGFPRPISNLPLDHVCKCFGCPMPMRIIVTVYYFAKCPQQSQSQVYWSSLNIPLPAPTSYTIVLSAPVPHWRAQHFAMCAPNRGRVNIPGIS